MKRKRWVCFLGLKRDPTQVEEQRPKKGKREREREKKINNAPTIGRVSCFLQLEMLAESRDALKKN